jgi:hypothetical protein
MFSLQRLLSKDDKFFSLMDGCAEEARSAIRNLVDLLRTAEGEHAADVFMMDLFIEARRQEKRLTQELTEHLCRTFVTPLEREDIEALSNALYKIPKTAEKFGERYMLAGRQTRGVDLTRHAELLRQAAEVVVIMVRDLRKGVNLETVKQQNDQLQQIEAEADKLMLDSLRELYSGKHAGLLVVVMKDLLELLEKVYDRCRDVGNIVFHIVLKHS